jgi:hypothetical protein
VAPPAFDQSSAAGARVEWKKRMRQRTVSWRRTADSSQVTGVTVLPSEIEPQLG